MSGRALSADELLDRGFGRMVTDVPALASTILTSTVANFPQLSPREVQHMQALCMGEEAGEALGAYRRWAGMARRSGTFDDVRHELADVVISAHVLAAALDFDLGQAIDEKAEVILSRGWREQTPTG